MKQCIFLAAIFCLAASAGAEDMTIKGKYYYAAHLEQITATNATVVHRLGSKLVEWKDLSPSIQARYASEHNAALALLARPAPTPVPARGAEGTATNSAPPRQQPQTHGTAPPATDIVLKDGTVYRGASIVSLDPASVNIRYQGGMARVDLADLTDETRTKVAPDYNPRKAEEYLLAESQANKAQAEQDHLQEVMRDFDAASLAFRGTITQITDDGAMMKGMGSTASETRYIMVHGANMPVETKEGAIESYDSVFVVGVGDGKVDGDSWQGRVWPAGRYRYTSVAGATRTIPRLAASRDVALRLLKGE